MLYDSKAHALGECINQIANCFYSSLFAEFFETNWFGFSVSTERILRNKYRPEISNKHYTAKENWFSV